MKYICISDIHGRGRELLFIVSSIENRIKNEDMKFVFLGDYIDRNKENASVIQTIIRIKEKYPDTIILMGNHEEFALGAYNYDMLDKDSILKKWYKNSEEIKNSWFRIENGGRYTYKELSENPMLYSKFIDMIANLPSIAIENGLVFTHAPIYDLYPEDSSIAERLWNFDNYTNVSRLPYINIHGHIHSFMPSDYPVKDSLFRKINVSHFPNLKVCIIDTEEMPFKDSYF